MPDSFTFDRWLFPFAAFLILLTPLSWLTAALTAALIHELCHVLAVYLLGGRILRIHVGVTGAVMETELSGIGKELPAILAGPAGSLSLIALCHVFPRLAICGFVQGIFNLLPIHPLDGGRALFCILEWLIPDRVERVFSRVEILLLCILAALGIVGTFLMPLGMLPLLVALMLILKTISRKRPCKRKQIRVQ